MKILFLVFAILCLVSAKHEKRAIEISSFRSGVASLLRAAGSKTYDHNLGGGSVSTAMINFDGSCYMCNERASILALIQTDATYVANSPITVSMTWPKNLKYKTILSTCNTTPKDSRCVNAATATVMTSGTPTETGFTFVVSKMPCSATVVIRIDLIVDCSAPKITSGVVQLSTIQVGSGTAWTIGSADDSIVTFSNIPSVLNCDDANPCTTDSADGPCVCTRTCKHAPMTCNDGSVCTTDTCVNGACQYNQITCDDKIACTTDTCDAVKGCIYTAGGCCDNDACTLDVCDKTKGCVNTPIPCDDNNACTTESCNPTKGCVIAAICCCDKDAVPLILVIPKLVVLMILFPATTMMHVRLMDAIRRMVVLTKRFAATMEIFVLRTIVML
jgi:hypothetical protein